MSETFQDLAEFTDFLVNSLKEDLSKVLHEQVIQPVWLFVTADPKGGLLCSTLGTHEIPTEDANVRVHIVRSMASAMNALCVISVFEAWTAPAQEGLALADHPDAKDVIGILVETYQNNQIWYRELEGSIPNRTFVSDWFSPPSDLKGRMTGLLPERTVH